MNFRPAKESMVSTFATDRYLILTAVIMLIQVCGCVSDKVDEDGIIIQYQQNQAAQGPQSRADTALAGSGYLSGGFNGTDYPRMRDKFFKGTMKDLCKQIRDESGTEQFAAFNFDPRWNWNNQTATMADGTTPLNLQESLRESMAMSGYESVPLMPARRDNSKWIGIDQVTDFLRVDPLTQLPSMAFSTECEDLFDEMRRYSCVRSKDRDPTAHRPRIREIDDDGPDCVRIAVTSPLEWLGGYGGPKVESSVEVDEWGFSW